MRPTSIVALASALAGAFALSACSNSTEPGNHQKSGFAPCPSGASPVTVSLPVGGVQVLGTPPSLDCVSLSAASGATYVVVAGNASPAPDDTMTYSISDSGSGLLARMLKDRLLSQQRTAVAPAAAGLFSSMAEGRFRARERHALHLTDPLWRRTARANMLNLSRIRGAARIARAVSLPSVGDTLSYNVPNATSDSVCTDFTHQRAVVKAVGAHGIIVQDVTAPSGGFTTADFNSLSAEFDSDIYAADTLHFGQPSDIDGNGHVLLLLTPQVNAGTKRGSQGVLNGFFFGGDLFPPSLCPESNQAEIFYLLVPDPNGTFSDARTTSDVRQSIRGTIAHEFQHMINLGVRIRDNAPDEATWMNEGLSHFAEELVGRREDGFTDMQSLNIGDVASNLDDFNAFYGQNLGRFREYLFHPNRYGAISVYADTNLAVRGAAWSLLRWSADQYANSTNSIAPFTRALVAGPDTGLDNLVARAGAPVDSLMAGWLVANVADDAGVTDLPVRFTYKSWDMTSAEEGINNGQYPLPLLSLKADSARVDTVSSTAAQYYIVSSSSSPIVLGAVATDGTPLSFAGARLYILRVQ